MAEKQIVYIKAGHIRPHPENPRKDLGDLSELTESIRKNGVLQNLTVIPVENEPGEYMTVIGHRRYAAGIQAGVEEFPCQVAENLTAREQVSIMLEENMQRNDLTIWEQANGFQMMLNLGETEESIAEKTGFSRTTVRHRLNIAKLNKEVLRKKEKDESFQLTLKDLYELEKIPDISTRNRILREASDSNNLVQMARTAVSERRRKDNEKEYARMCKEDGIEPAPEGTEYERYSGKWEIVKEFGLDEDVKDGLRCKTRAAKEKLFYVTFWGRTFAIIAKKAKEKRELTPAEIARKKKEKQIKEIKAMRKVMDAEREEFIKTCISENFRPADMKPEDFLPGLFSLLVKANGYLTERTMRKFLTGKDWFQPDTHDEEIAEYEKRRDGLCLLHKMMIFAADAVGGKELTEWNGFYRKESGKLVMELDEILAQFGFSYTKEDFYKVAEGTYELYEKEEEDEAEPEPEAAATPSVSEEV